MVLAINLQGACLEFCSEAKIEHRQTPDKHQHFPTHIALLPD